MNDTTLSFSIQRTDHDLFGGLNDRARKLVTDRLKAMRRIYLRVANDHSVRAACTEIAAMFHMERGWSVETLTRLYVQFTKSKNANGTNGDWKVLVDASIAGPNWQNGLNDVVPGEFLDFLAKRWARNQRDKFRSIYTDVLRQLEKWRGGDESCAIPGYDEPPKDDAMTGRPRGWSLGNLHRSVKPRVSKFARKLVQIGPKAASNIGPQVLATRVGLAVGQYYILDDSWNDAKVIAERQSVRLLSFHALDLFSGCNVLRGYKPALRDERDCEQRLKEREMIFLLVTLLTMQGYRPSGTTFICEKATATIRDREIEILANTLGDVIKVETGPRGGGPGIAGLFTGPGGGSPRWKAPLESWFNLLRNRTADVIEFPGQTGSYSSGLPMPEGLPGLEKDTLALVSAARALPPEDAKLLQLGMLTAQQAIFKLDAVTEAACNCRSDHALEGWRDCGHVITEWRPSTLVPWQPNAKLLAMPDAEALAVAAVLNQNPALKRERFLSPREVFDAGKSQLTKLPLTVAALLLGDVEPAEGIVKKGVIEVSCSAVSQDEPLRYGLVRRDGRGTKEPLRDDEKYAVRVNELDPRYCWLYNAAGGFVGVAPIYGRTRRDDAEALRRSYVLKRQALAPRIEEGRRMAGDVTRTATERTANNTRVFNAQKTKLKKFEGDVADLAEMPAAPVDEVTDTFSAEDLL